MATANYVVCVGARGGETSDPTISSVSQVHLIAGEYKWPADTNISVNFSTLDGYTVIGIARR